MLILAADIGGTSARLLLARGTDDGWQTLRLQTLASRKHADFSSLLRAFLLSGEHPQAACIALAGPLEHQRVQLTNLPWSLDAAELAESLGLRQVELVNDFVAQAHGLPLLQPHQLCTLQTGAAPPEGVRALLGAGSGLGMALVAGTPQQPLVLRGEGGHADFAPQDEQQLALLRHLLPRHGRVSLELLLSGPGLTRLYAFLGGQSVDAPTLPSAAQISQAAAAGEVLAVATLELFARLYAAVAGNLALTALARGGVYLCGGIAPKILPFLQRQEVREAFCAKPPMRALLERIPLHVVLDEQLGLRGAAQIAVRLARQAD
ncbi:glucokinase [Pseudomonas linyingensis]|uniref:Glucokinase n=1 Tax=Pseudomonas linyingensis TaxID=915471 RepID=A0A1H7A9G4_9PSED|nr:glucokinase [Pseudomonas linyingensis]SEJ58530.1 glucokinase [Pseudomonas linyingensis]